MATTRILVVDDHPLFRQGLAWALEPHRDLAIVGVAGTVSEALEQAARAQADLVLCDLNLPDGDGLALTRQLRRLYPLMQVIIVTLHMEDETILGALRAGAAAFITKDTPGDAMLATIRRVARGEYPINDRVTEYPGVAMRLLDQFRDLSAVPDADPEVFSPLTPRELGVLEAAASGQANKEIARALGISDQTVKNHMTSVMRKLAVNDRTQAVMHALRHGWLRLDEGGDVRQR
ncbi:MAG TPA: response regulator transcription factor [Thermomicrobiales bacterium]|jgi:DNA-binding NarL/FixJ family response regulator